MADRGNASCTSLLQLLYANDLAFYSLESGHFQGLCLGPRGSFHWCSSELRIHIDVIYLRINRPKIQILKEAFRNIKEIHLKEKQQCLAIN